MLQAHELCSTLILVQRIHFTRGSCLGVGMFRLRRSFASLDTGYAQHDMALGCQRGVDQRYSLNCHRLRTSRPSI